LLPKVVSFQHDNDVIFDSDRDYSSGLFLRVKNWGAFGQLANAITALFVPQDKRHLYRSSFGLLIGQEIYTPMITDRLDFVPYERPFAGWLYIGAEYELASPTWHITATARLGYTGRWTLAQELQQAWHGVIYLFYQGTSLGRGWGYQLPTEVTFQANLNAKWYLFQLTDRGNKYMEFGLEAELAVGNVFVHPEVKLLWRFGWLPRRANDRGVKTWESKPDKPEKLTRNNWSFQFFFEPFARLVVRNLFLDGLAFTESHRIPRYPGVIGFEGGFDWRLDWFRLRLGVVWQTLDAPYALRVYQDHKFFRLTFAYEG
jgi:hypothetical protein